MTELFPRLSIEDLKKEARKWAKNYQTILTITLHASPDRLDSLYTLVFEVIDPKNDKWYSLDFAMKQVDGSFFGKSFLNVYKAYSEIMTAEELAKCSDIPRRFSEQWDIRTIGQGEQIPSDLSTIDFVQIFPGSYEEKKAQAEKFYYYMAERALIPAERLWESIIDKLPKSIQNSSQEDFLKIAQKTFSKFNFAPLSIDFLDTKLFNFSEKRMTKEREDFLKRIIKKFIDNTEYGPISENKCHQTIKKIKKSKK